MIRHLITMVCTLTSAFVVAGHCFSRTPFYCVYCKVFGIVTITVQNESNENLKDLELAFYFDEYESEAFRSRNSLSAGQRWELVFQEPELYVKGLELRSDNWAENFRDLNRMVHCGEEFVIRILPDGDLAKAFASGDCGWESRDQRLKVVPSDKPEPIMSNPFPFPYDVTSIVWDGRSFEPIELDREIVEPILRRNLAEDHVAKYRLYKISDTRLVVKGADAVISCTFISGHDDLLLCRHQGGGGCFRIDGPDFDRLFDHISTLCRQANVPGPH